MASFFLRIMTPEKVFLARGAQGISVDTEDGQRGFLARHESYMAALPTGSLRIRMDDAVSVAAISGGVIRVDHLRNEICILADTCEWATDIDVERAKTAENNARAVLNAKKSRHEMEIAKARLTRAMNRLRIVSK